MAMNQTYAGPDDCPAAIPVFPLPGALLLPRGQMPLNIFEPRYLAMIEDAVRGDRVIGLVQPKVEGSRAPQAGPIPGVPPLYEIGCAGRITQFAETGDGRFLISLTGIARFRIAEELATTTLYRQCRVDFAPFAADFEARAGEDAVDREGVIRVLRDFVEAAEINLDWKGVDEAPNEALVNALCMMSPFGVREKQALLEAPDLKSRAEVLIAVTELELAKKSAGQEPILQ